jgi:PAS domain S-box-containing protein
LYGWKAEEVLGKKLTELLFRRIPESYAQGEQEVLAAGEWSGEFHQAAKDGQALLVESYWSLLHDMEGRPRGRVVINIDVTERKKLELQFRRSQRLESIGTLASGIAHDLNNVLTPILMAVKLLRKERPPADREVLLNAAQASVERGAQMVKQLLSFAGGMEGERVAVDLRYVVGEVRSLLQHTLPKAIQIEVRTPGELWTVRGDATQLSQVLMNLCVNARDAMPRGGRLTIALENTRLHEGLSAVVPDAHPGPYVLMQVSDTGMGIPQELLERVFDPFFTTKEMGKGTGLGLSTAMGIVKSHGGFINIYSEEGQGTRINVFLPALESPESIDSLSYKPATQSAAGAGECVLVVDDEEAIRRTAQIALQSNGYKTICAAGGAEAVAIYGQRGSEVDVVLLDMMMPGMDGLATIRSIRTMNPDARIVATSGLHVKGRSGDAIAAGAKVFLQKPYSDERLLAALREALTTSQE